jgi:prepilin peptidase CpaA
MRMRASSNGRESGRSFLRAAIWQGFTRTVGATYENGGSRKMMAQILVIAVLPIILALAAGWDLASYTIPNFLQAALVAAFAVYALAAGLPFSALGWHLLAGLSGLVIGFTLFALNWIGGGDAKLFAAASLWLGFNDLLIYALAASVLGGALTLAILMARRIPLPSFLRQNWLLRLHDEKAGIPYGVALAAGAFAVLPQSEIFRLAAGG